MSNKLSVMLILFCSLLFSMMHVWAYVYLNEHDRSIAELKEKEE